MTLAKALADSLRADYIKSLLPDDAFGQKIRMLRDGRADETTVNLSHIVDLFRNELQIAGALADGKSVARDKRFLSGLARFCP